MGLLWAFQRSLIYLPDDGPVGAAGDAAARCPRCHAYDQRRAAARRVVPAGPAPDAPAVLVASGNGGHRGMRAPLARALGEAGLAVLLFDYRGYGGNPGSPSERGLARDVRAARQFLLRETQVPRSGSSTSARASARRSSPSWRRSTRRPGWSSARRSSTWRRSARCTTRSFRCALLLRDRYPVAEQIGRIRVPTTVVYGSADSIVPPAQSRAVADAAAQLHRLVEVPGADHNDPVLLDGEAVVSAVVDLARAAG